VTGPHKRPGVYVEEVPSGARTISGAATSVAAFIGPTARGAVGAPVRIDSLRDFLREFGGARAGGELAQAVRLFFLNGGQSAWVVRTGPPGAKTLFGAKTRKTSLEALDGLDDVNLLLIPDTAGLSDRTAAEVIAGALDFCAKRRAFYLVDPPQRDAARDTPESILAWLRDNPAVRHPNAALYFPRLRIAGRSRKPEGRRLPASGALAGLYARIDAMRGVWKAPAGSGGELRGVPGLAYETKAPEIGALAREGVNALQRLGRGRIVVQGARTLAGGEPESEWKYIPVRRLMLFIEESVYRGTQWAVFEPNGTALWAQLRLNVSSFLHELFRDGAFAGATPEQAYFVKCDEETNPQSEIDLGCVNFVVGFAPLKPAEFVILKIHHSVAQGS
jgi:phage tail sheath protein FI